MTIQLYDIKDVMGKVRCSEAFIYKRIALGSFPKPQKIGTMSRWRSEIIDAWIEEELPAKGQP